MRKLFLLIGFFSFLFFIPTPIPAQETPKYKNQGELWWSPHISNTYDIKKVLVDGRGWEEERKKVSVIKLHDLHLFPPWKAQWLELGNQDDEIKFLNDQELKTTLENLKKWGIKLALEGGSVKSWGCNGDMPAEIALAVIDRIEKLGGKVDYITMDEPLISGLHQPNSSDYPPGCALTIEQTTQATANYIKKIRAKYPHIAISDIEPWPSINRQEIIYFLDLLAKETGGYLPYFTLDVNYALAKVNKKDFSQIAKIAADVRARGMKFEIIIWESGYNYPSPLDSDKAFYQNSMGFAREVHSLIYFDRVSLQSWNNYPLYFFENTSPWGFQKLLRDYSNQYPPSLLPTSPLSTTPSTIPPPTNFPVSVTAAAAIITPLPVSLCFSCSPARPLKSQGNANCDGQIDLKDFSAWLSLYRELKTGISPDHGLLTALDFTCTTATQTINLDLEDYLIWYKNYLN